MLKILFVWPKPEEIEAFRRGLEKSEVEIVWKSSGEEALKFVKENNNLALAVVAENLPDMSGLDFVQKLLTINAMICTAVASHLAADEFHEASEGLGILTQLPLHPEQKHAEKLSAHLAKIGMIAQQTIGHPLS